MNIADFVRDSARADPDGIAIVRADDTAISYRDFDRWIDALARHARGYGLKSGDIAGLSIAGPDEALALTLALALARIGVATAETSLPARHLAKVFLQPGQTAPPGALGQTVPLGATTIALDRSWPQPGAADDGSPPPASHPGGGAPCRVFATSGTTGGPRHCVSTHTAMAARVEGHEYGMVNDRGRTAMICALGLGGASGLRSALTVFKLGGTLVFTNMAGIVNAILRHGVTSLVTSPIMLRRIAAMVPDGVGPLPPLRVIRVSGSQLPLRLAEIAARKLCPNLVTSFGSTETGNICLGRFGAIGVPLGVGTIVPGVTVEAVDAHDTPLPAGTEGLLRFRAPGAVDGYFNDEAATRASFRDGWFYSGDLGAVTAGGVMIVTGRIGDFINSGGVKVDPRTIEEVLLTLPGVSDAVAFGVPDPDGLAQIWAAIVPATPIDGAVLNRICGQRLGATAPKFILQMRELPRNANGKIVTAVLIEFAAAQYKQSAGNA